MKRRLSDIWQKTIQYASKVSAHLMGIVTMISIPVTLLLLIYCVLTFSKEAIIPLSAALAAQVYLSSQL